MPELFSGQFLGEQKAGASTKTRTGPDSGSGKVQVLDRCGAIGVAAGGAEQEVLAQVVRAANLVAADEVWVVCFQLGRRHDAFA